MSVSKRYDAIVVGGGTAGCYAASTMADQGLEVSLLERKSKDEAGHIACGDALKGAGSFPDTIDEKELHDSFTNAKVEGGRFEFPDGEYLDVPVPGELAVVDRKRYGETLLESAEEKGVDVRYGRVVDGLLQDGKVRGVEAKEASTEKEARIEEASTEKEENTDGERETYLADVVVDACGALSILQEELDLDSTFDHNVRYSQFCSAYREIIRVDQPVDWSDRLVFKPIEQSAGYLWYFPRTPTKINAGLGFQMDGEPMELVDELRDDLVDRPEFEDAEVVDKLGAALPTRRPLDSAVAPGYLACGDAACHVNPTTGGGIAGAAYAGQYAGEAVAHASEEDDFSEEKLWRYNSRVMEKFGARYAALDVYNVFISGHGNDEVISLMSKLPGEKISDLLYQGETRIPLSLKIRSLISSFGHWGLIYKLYLAKKVSEEVKEVYRSYPDSPSEFYKWRERRDEVFDRIYELADTEPKY
ncbi:MAG: geranylgeranyl reductase family protein [Halobacteria archaeon]